MRNYLKMLIDTRTGHKKVFWLFKLSEFSQDFPQMKQRPFEVFHEKSEREKPRPTNPHPALRYSSKIWETYCQVTDLSDWPPRYHQICGARRGQSLLGVFCPFWKVFWKRKSFEITNLSQDRKTIFHSSVFISPLYQSPFTLASTRNIQI